MKEIPVTDAEAASIRQGFDEQQREVDAYMKRHSVVSAEALVMDDTPTSDVDAD